MYNTVVYMVYSTVYHKMKVGRVVRDAAPVTRGHQGGYPDMVKYGIYGKNPENRVFWGIWANTGILAYWGI